MKRPRVLRNAVFALIFLASSAGWCSDTAFAGRTAIIFPISDLSQARENTEWRDSLTEALNAEFLAAGFRLLRASGDESGTPEPGKSLAGSAAAAAARRDDADMAVSGGFAVEADRIIVLLSCYEAQSGALVGGFLKSWPFSLAFYVYLRAEIETMLAGLSLPAPPGQDPRQSTAAGITFTSRQDGMEVLLGGEWSAGTIDQGRLFLSTGVFKEGAPLLLEKRMAGYHTAWQTVRAAREVALAPLARKSTFGLEASWTAGEFLGGGLGARLYLFPDSLFISAGLTLSIEPPALPNAGAVTRYDTLVSLGQYLFFPPDAPVRTGIGTGVGTVFTTVAAAGPAVYTDVFWDVVSIWAEWNLATVSLFARTDLRYTLGVGTNLLGRGLLSWKVSFPAADGNPVTFSLPPLTLGAVVKL